MRLNICVELEYLIAFIFIIFNKTVSCQKGKSIDKHSTLTKLWLRRFLGNSFGCFISESMQWV